MEIHVPITHISWKLAKKLFARAYLKGVLEHHKGNISKTARALKYDRKSMKNKIVTGKHEFPLLLLS